MRISPIIRMAGAVAFLIAGGLGCGGSDSSGTGAGGKGGSSTPGDGGSGGVVGSTGGSSAGGSGGSNSSGSGGTSTGGAPATGGTGPGTGGGAGGGSGGAGAAAGSSGSGGRGGGGGAAGGAAGATGSGGAAGQAGKGGGAGGGGGAGHGGTTGGAGAGGATGGNNGSGPPMGWASWNSFAAKINYSVIKAQADAMVSSGLKDAGYQYVNIDEGWWQGTRDGSGNITVDTTTDWPGGMQAIATYIHGLGLKAGIYTDAGKDGCGYYYPTGRPAAPGSGSEGHYDQDFLQFSKWGFDFVKVDWCGGNSEGLNPQTAYQAISNSIKTATAQTGRPMVFSVCDWGNQSPWNWGPGMSTMWRTSQDIIYFGEQADLNRVLTNFDSAQHPTAQTPGHYNDPDMLIVGMPSFTAAQNRTHMALWAISSAPLLAGNNLMTMTSDTKSVLTNAEVIAIDQDPLAKQGTKLSGGATGLEIYNKVLSGTGRRAVLLLNRNASAATITVRFSDLGLGATASVRNVWMAMDLGSKTTSYGVSVPAHDSVLLLVTDGAAQ
jgi:hypothetical protein